MMLSIAKPTLYACCIGFSYIIADRLSGYQLSHHSNWIPQLLYLLYNRFRMKCFRFGVYIISSFTGLANSSKTQKETKLSPEIICFESKRQKLLTSFRLKYPLKKQNNSANHLNLKVKRTQVFEDTTDLLIPFLETTRLPTLEIRITFVNEPGLDYGGLSKEWLSEISKSICSDVKHKIFVVSEADKSSLQLHPQWKENKGFLQESTNMLLSTISFMSSFTPWRERRGHCQEETPLSPSDLKPHNLHFYQCFGIILGLAITYKHHLNATFDILFLKLLLKRDITERDYELTDPNFYRNLTGLLSYSIDEADLALTFSVSEPLGENKYRQINLMKNGHKIRVTDNNKINYIEKMLKHKYQYRLKPFVDAIRQGFEKILTVSDLTSFSIKEIQFLFGGSQSEIDIKDWELNTKYAGGYTANSQSIIWFWEIVKSMTEQERRKLLQFVTGSTRVPPAGFSQLPGGHFGNHLFTISRYRKLDSLLTAYLPQAHTCSNTLDWPPYDTYVNAKRMLLLAINESGTFEQK